MDLELTQEKKDSLIRRVTELAEGGVLNLVDWMAIYDICLEACNRKSAEIMEQYLTECLNEEDE